jgi:hypothetical protein
MAITRTQAAAHLHTQFSVLASEISQAETDDSATGYGPDLDQALRYLGEGESSLATATVMDTTGPAYLALAEYYCLRRMARQLSLASTDVRVGEMSQKLGQRASTLAGLIDEARTACASLGHPVDGSPAWSTGSINLDYTEPEPTT